MGRQYQVSSAEYCMTEEQLTHILPLVRAAGEKGQDSEERAYLMAVTAAREILKLGGQLQPNLNRIVELVR